MKRILFFVLLFSWVSNTQAQIIEDLIAWYPFSGNAIDSSDNGHNGQVSGPILVEDRFGNPEEAYQFDGVNDFIVVPDQQSLWLSNQDYSIALWVKFISSPESDSLTCALVSKRINYSSGNGYLFQRIGLNNPVVPIAGKINFIVSGGNSPMVNSSSTVDAGGWHHLVFAFSVDSEIGQLYVDGILETEGIVFSPASSNGASLYFGKDGLTGHFYFNGVLDDIRIYGKKLTGQEVLDIMEYNPVSSADRKYFPLCDIKVFPNPAESGSISIEPGNCQINTVRISGSEGLLLWEGPFSKEVDLAYLPGRTLIFEFFDSAGQRMDVKKVIVTGQ